MSQSPIILRPDEASLLIQALANHFPDEAVHQRCRDREFTVSNPLWSRGRPFMVPPMVERVPDQFHFQMPVDLRGNTAARIPAHVQEVIRRESSPTNGLVMNLPPSINTRTVKRLRGILELETEDLVGPLETPPILRKPNTVTLANIAPRDCRVLMVGQHHFNLQGVIEFMADLEAFRKQGFNYLAPELHHRYGRYLDWADEGFIIMDTVKRYSHSRLVDRELTRPSQFNSQLFMDVAFYAKQIGYNVEPVDLEGTTQERDDGMANRIADILKRDPDARILWFGGNYHLDQSRPDKSPTLFDNLQQMGIRTSRIAMIGGARLEYEDLDEQPKTDYRYYYAEREAARIDSDPTQPCHFTKPGGAIAEVLYNVPHVGFNSSEWSRYQAETLVWNRRNQPDFNESETPQLLDAFNILLEAKGLIKQSALPQQRPRPQMELDPDLARCLRVYPVQPREEISRTTVG